MNDQLDNAQSKGSHRSRQVFTALPSYLIEAELDREWERRHRQGFAENPPVSSPKEEFGS